MARAWHYLSMTMSDQETQDSYEYCRTVAKTQAGNFYYSFIVLPYERRRAMHAVYSFMRYCDDIVDEGGADQEKRALLEQWRGVLDTAYQEGSGQEHPILPAFRDTVKRFEIPKSYFEAVIDGAAMDLTVPRYDTFEDLYKYCYHVASAVGLVCISIFGFTDEEAKFHAESCGIAFQLTNILRDVREDAEMGRIYLPQEDLKQYSYSEDDIQKHVIDERFTELMKFEVDRASDYYDRALPLLPLIHRSSRPCLAAMIGIYRRHLEEIEHRGYDVFTERVRLPAWKKLSIAIGAFVRKTV
jgi:15-cis-phytoene synthase